VLLRGHFHDGQSSAAVSKSSPLVLLNMTLKQVGTTSSSKIMLIATTNETAEKIKTLKSDPLMMGFDEEARRLKARKTYDASQAHSQSNPRIGAYEALRGPDYITPTPEQALALLKRIATDAGILKIMDKYNWHVGLLKEMSPEGMCL